MTHPIPSAYRQQLHPWCIIRLLPKAQRITVARFRKRNDADAHLRVLRRLIPNATFIIVFAPPITETDLEGVDQRRDRHRDDAVQQIQRHPHP